LARDDTFSETIFKGPLHIMLKNALTHIKSMVIKEKVVKYPDRPEASINDLFDPIIFINVDKIVRFRYK
jgi:hypothetical protein